MAAPAIMNGVQPMLKTEPSNDLSEGLPGQKSTYRSYKKKYLKIRHGFKETMRECNSLFDEEQRAIRLTRRLQEQNDQLLELLLDINESSRIPPSLSYDLRSPILSPSDVPALTPDKSPKRDPSEAEGVRSALREVKAELDSGQIGPAEYKDIEASLTAMITRPTLTNLSKISHSILEGAHSVPTDLLPESLKEDSPAGYLSPEHEEDYLSTLDAYLETGPQDAYYLPPKPKITEKDRERDNQLHNPVSVYNWLVRNRQEIFVHSPDEEQKEKPVRPIPSSKSKSSPRPTPVPSRGSKRKSAGEAVAAAVMKQEEEILDDEGNVIGPVVEAVDSKKRKRKGEDDAYRPKGGTSRPKKRGRAGTGTKERMGDGEEEL